MTLSVGFRKTQSKSKQASKQALSRRFLRRDEKLKERRGEERKVGISANKVAVHKDRFTMLKLCMCICLSALKYKRTCVRVAENN